MPYSPEGAVAADESGRQPSRPGRSSSDPDNGFIDSISNTPQNVNTDPRYKLNQSQNQSKPSAIDNLNNAIDKYRADKQRRQQPLQETINNIQDNPKPKMTKELRQAIDNFIFENELFIFIASNPVTVPIKMRRISRFAAANMTIAGSTRLLTVVKM